MTIQKKGPSFTLLGMEGGILSFREEQLIRAGFSTHAPEFGQHKSMFMFNPIIKMHPQLNKFVLKQNFLPTEASLWVPTLREVSGTFTLISLEQESSVSVQEPLYVFW